MSRLLREVSDDIKSQVGATSTHRVLTNLFHQRGVHLGRTYQLNFGGNMEVWDSPNSAGVVIDAVRCAKLAMDRGISGALEGPSSYFMKTPPKQFTDDEAYRFTEAFIAGEQ